MSEWIAYVRARLRLSGLRAEREVEVVEDLARQLEDAYADALARGAAEPDARSAAHQHISDWQTLGRDVERSERWKESRMTEGQPAVSTRNAAPGRPALVAIGSDVLQDVIYGLRMFRKRPGVTAVSLLTLALGIGANTAIFSVIDAVMLRALPVRHPDELVLLKWTATKRPSLHNSSSYGDCANQFVDVRASGCSFSHPFLSDVVAQSTSFTGVAAFANAGQITITGHGAAGLARGQYVSGGYFDTLGVQPAAGRILHLADDTPGAPPAIVLSHGYWQRNFAGDPQIVGQTLFVNGKPFTIAGVAEPRFTSLTPGVVRDLWIPLSFKPQLVERFDPKNDNAYSWWIVIVARLRPGVRTAAAQAEIVGLFRNDTLLGPKPIFREADNPSVLLLPAQTGLVGVRARFSQPLDILMAVVGAILLIACANVAGLMISRAAARQKEMAIRLSLGASRARIVRQWLTESVVLAVFGGALALILATWASRLLAAMMGTMAGRPDLGLNISLDARVFAFTTSISFLAGILFGIAPAVRGTQVELTPALKDALGRAAGARRRLSAGGALVVAQVALTVVVLIGAGLLVRTLQNLRGVDAGFQTQNLLTFGIDMTLARARSTTADQVSADLQRQFSELPGVVGVSYAEDVLLSGSSSSNSFPKPGASDHTDGEANRLAVGPHFFDTLRLSIRAGRDFRADEYAAAAARRNAPASDGAKDMSPVPAIVNELFVKTYFPQVDPIGQTFGASKTPEYAFAGWVIVGIVSDAKYDDLRKEVVPTFYVPISGAGYFALRTAGDPATVVSSIRAIAQRMDLPVFAVKTETEQIDELLYQERLVAQLSGFFGLLALALASIGLYGLLSHDVSRRTREIGIRMALGAPRATVLRLVVGHGATLALIGAALGTIAGVGATRYLGSLLYGVGPADPATLAAVAVLLVAVSVAACLIPARRATRVDPLIALRYD
jgi:predicted permease